MVCADMKSVATERINCRLRTIGGLCSLVAVVVLLLVEPFHGPVLFSGSASHGLDLGDIAAVPFALLAVALLRDGPLHRWARVRLRVPDRDPAGVGVVALIATGGGLVLVAIFEEAGASSVVPHAAALPAVSAKLLEMRDVVTCHIPHRSEEISSETFCRKVDRAGHQ